MDRNLFRYVWQTSRREQILILLVVLASLPFYFVSLDLPKYIVNDAIQGRAFQGGRTEAMFLPITLHAPAWLGGAEVKLFAGIPLERMPFLFALSTVFLVMVLINGAFKYWINVRKGALGERLLQRLRSDLFSALVRFTPESFRNVKPSEMATVINNEVEPIGGFVGDAFIAPVFLGGQAVTALVFIIVQSPSLGAIAAFVVVAQALLIPRLRREQLRLGKERQIAARALAGQIGEVVEGISAIHSHGTTAYELARVDRRLGQLFTIRFKLYNRKFMVKFINNLLAQMTPFIFYSLGGYLALTGKLDIGQLVAVIAAYRELPPPVKELIDWDQQRLDVQVKYDQVMDQFANSAQIAAPGAAPAVATLGTTDLETTQVKVADSRGHVLVDGLSLSLPLPSHVALTADGGDGPDILARILGRQMMAFSGKVKIDGFDMLTLPADFVGRTIAYVGPESVIFQGTIRDNVAYGLHLKTPEAGRGAADADWLDYGVAGATGPEDLDRRIVEALHIVGLDETVYRFGLSGLVKKKRFPGLAERVVEARREIFHALAASGSTELIEAFDPARYNRNSTVSENLLFGIPIGQTLAGDGFIEHPFIRATLETSGLTNDLVAMGATIASTMIDIFADLPPDHFLFEQFSFIRSEDLPEFAAIMVRRERGEALQPAEEGRLIGLTLRYVEPRHRLSLIDADRETRIVAARELIRTTLPPELGRAIEFYDPDKFCQAAPLRDNLLFGRITYGVAGAEGRVLAVVREAIARLGLDHDVYRLGLDFHAGAGGRSLTPAQRAAVSLARALVKRPSVLVLNDALVQFGDAERKTIFQRILEACEGRTLLCVMRSKDDTQAFDHIVAFAGPRLRGVTDQRAADADRPGSLAASA
jgi:putative ABC transport system ATP-binding protein